MRPSTQCAPSGRPHLDGRDDAGCGALRLPVLHRSTHTHGDQMKLRNKRTAGVIGAAVLMVTMSAAPSHAAEKIGTPVSGPGGSCADGFVANSHVKVCWMRDGDRLYV